MIFKSLSFASVIVLRKKYPDMNRPYKVIAYPFAVYLIIAIMIGLCINTLMEDPFTSLIGLIVPCLLYTSPGGFTSPTRYTWKKCKNCWNSRVLCVFGYRNL